MSKSYIKYSDTSNFDTIDKLMNNINGEVLRSFNKEINTLLDQISNDYNLSNTELKEKYLIDTDIISDQNVKVYNKNKCCAITNKNKQCTRNKNENSEYCKSHSKKLKKMGYLVNGTIFDNKDLNSKKITCDQLIDINNDIDNDIIVERKICNDQELFITPITNKKYIKDENDKLIEN